MRFTDVDCLGIRYFHVQGSFELINQFLSRRGIKSVPAKKSILAGIWTMRKQKCFPSPASLEGIQGYFRFYCVLKERLTEVILRWHWIECDNPEVSGLFCQSVKKDFSGIISRKVDLTSRQGKSTRNSATIFI